VFLLRARTGANRWVVAMVAMVAVVAVVAMGGVVVVVW